MGCKMVWFARREPAWEGEQLFRWSRMYAALQAPAALGARAGNGGRN